MLNRKRLIGVFTLILVIALICSVTFTGISKSTRVFAEAESTSDGGSEDGDDGDVMPGAEDPADSDDGDALPDEDEPADGAPDEDIVLGSSQDEVQSPDTEDGSNQIPDPADTVTTGEESSDEESEEEKAAKEKETRRHSLILAAIGGGISALFIIVILLTLFKKKDGVRPRITTQQLTESALMVAIATVCSIVKIDLPFGGGVTVVSMLPLVIISHRYGWRWGVTTAFVYSVIQLFLGLDNVGYATSTFMAFGVIFLDYIVAYTVIGLSGIFGRSRKAVIAGICVTFTLRFICHYVTGVWIWKEWMPETFMGMTMTSPWIYSALYNGWYMLAELIITLIVANLIYNPLKKFFEAPEGKLQE